MTDTSLFTPLASDSHSPHDRPFVSLRCKGFRHSYLSWTTSSWCAFLSLLFLHTVYYRILLSYLFAIYLLFLQRNIFAFGYYKERLSLSFLQWKERKSIRLNMFCARDFCVYYLGVRIGIHAWPISFPFSPQLSDLIELWPLWWKYCT